MKEIFHKPYVYWLIILFLGYIILNMWISGFYETIPLIIAYANTVNWMKLGISLLLTVFIGVLVALNGVLVYIKYKERQTCKEGVALTSAGSVGGLVVGVCPLCITGIVPLVFGFFGITFSFASLPLQGIEIQLVVIVILSVSLYLLDNKNY